MKSKNSNHQFTILLTPDEDYRGFVVEVPALPGCVTQGNTLEEAKQHAKEAIELYLETLHERGLSIPDDVEPNFLKSKVQVHPRLQPA